MGVNVTSGDILSVFGYFNMGPAKKSGCIYVGMGNDGVYRTSKLDYHAGDRDLAPGTADKIAHDLGFRNTMELKDFGVKFKAIPSST